MKTVIFGGTSEGRTLAQARMRRGEEVLVCVTSEYARSLLPPGTRCLARAMDAAEMERLLAAEAPDAVLDATHPFAACATENILAATARLNIPYERAAREDSRGEDWTDAVEWVRDAREAARSLARTQGNILLTTGVNTLAVYVNAVQKERLYARVLPCARSLSVCEALGLPPGHVIAMQGPFPRALNAALYDWLRVRTIVSKDSGAAGGVPEKVIPALEREIHVVMIERPKEKNTCAENA